MPELKNRHREKGHSDISHLPTIGCLEGLIPPSTQPAVKGSPGHQSCNGVMNYQGYSSSLQPFEQFTSIHANMSFSYKSRIHKQHDRVKKITFLIVKLGVTMSQDF